MSDYFSTFAVGPVTSAMSVSLRCVLDGIEPSVGIVPPGAGEGSHHGLHG